MDVLKQPPERIVWPVILLTTGLLFYAISQYVLMERSTIMNNWAENRCSIPVMFGAYWLKPDSDTRSEGDFAGENFQFCLKEISQNVMKVVMAPFMASFGKQADITKVFTDILNSIKTVIKKMYDEFLSFLDPFFRKFNAITYQIGIVTQKLKAAFQRANASLLSVVFSGISTIKFFNNTIKFAIKVILIILGIMIAIIIILFFVLLPFIPIFITPVILAIMGAVGVIVSAEQSSEADGAQSAFCFEGTTPIKLADGSSKSISQLVLGEELANGASVEGILKLEGTKTPLYSLEGIYVSGSHLVYSGTKWHSVEQDSRAIPTNTRAPVLYCLNTSNQTIPVLNFKGDTILFRDWEEIDSEDAIGQHGWNRLVAKLLGSLENTRTEETFCLMDPTILIPTPKGSKTLYSIELGDEIELSYNNTTRVIGLVEGLVTGTGGDHWLSSCIEKTYNPTVYRRITTLKQDPNETRIGRHVITDSGVLIACVNGRILHLRDFTEVGINRIHLTYPFVAERLNGV